MGLSRAQKTRKHGSTTAQPAPGTANRPETPRSSPAVFVGAAMGVSALLWLYVNAWIIPGLGAAAAGGLTLPEWMVGGFDQEYARRLATALGEEGLAAYESVHRSTGLLAPLFVGLAWLLFVALSTPSRPRRWLRSAVVLGFAAVSLAGNTAIDTALADPGDGSAVATASALVIARWVLLVLLLAMTVRMGIQVLRRRRRAEGPPRG